jgi:hypothetical protein
VPGNLARAKYGVTSDEVDAIVAYLEAKTDQ